MTSRNCLTNGLIISSLTVFISVIGFRIGDSRIGEYNPSWEQSKIESVPENAMKIAYLDVVSTLEDPAGDIIYIEDNNGKVFSNTVFQNKWTTVDPSPSWNNNYVSKCATEWLGPHDYSHMGDLPPVEKEVIDSAGVRFERPVSTIVRCYVLFEDGSLDVWTHSGNAMDMLAGESAKLIYGVFGALFGAIIGIIILYFRKRAKTQTE